VKVAIVYDWLNQFGGGERVLMELHALFPRAPIYTTVFTPERLPEPMRSWDVRTSFLQRLPIARTQHRPFFPLMPLAFERFDLSGFDLVLSAFSLHWINDLPGALAVLGEVAQAHAGYLGVGVGLARSLVLDGIEEVVQPV
jgi:hypothetical protein